MILYKAGEDIKQGDLVTIHQDGMIYRALCGALTSLDTDLYGSIIIQCTMLVGHTGWHSKNVGRTRAQWPNDKITLPTHAEDDD